MHGFLCDTTAADVIDVNLTRFFISNPGLGSVQTHVKTDDGARAGRGRILPPWLNLLGVNIDEGGRL